MTIVGGCRKAVDVAFHVGEASNPLTLDSGRRTNVRTLGRQLTELLVDVRCWYELSLDAAHRTRWWWS